MIDIVLPLLAGASFENMNGEYVISPTPNASGTFNTKWNEYPGGAEYFEIYLGPITSLYSQVWWKMLPAAPLPKDLLERFDGKGMAVLGYEVDAVRKTPQGDISVPINMVYNHHHDAHITGKHSSMEKVPYESSDPTVPLMQRSDAHFLDVPVEHRASPLGIPTSAHLAAGNGGEYRKTYHGFASPVAYVIDSPQTVNVLPMFIDTWNRDEMNITGSPFVPGPVPKRSLAPTSGPDALYSGLLECPMTDKIEKTITGGSGFNSTYTPTIFQCASNVTSCAHVVATAEDCFDAARKAVSSNANTTLVTAEGASDSMPSGCTITPWHDGGAKVFFNTKQTGQCCGAGVTSLSGKSSSLIDLEMTVTNDTTTITLTGPDGVWFGAGFFAQTMNDKPYSIIVDGRGNVSERVMGNHAAGTLLPPSLAVVSDTSTTAGTRTVVVRRPSVGASPQHASFTMQDLEVPFISAIGNSPALAYHSKKTASSLSLWPTATAPAAAGQPDYQPVCLCEWPAAPFGSAVGTIKYKPTGEEFGFISLCTPAQRGPSNPTTDILAQRNPACDVRAYVGGLQVCKHMWSLLDAGQEQPWPDQPLEYYHKYRFYYQEYDPTRHIVSVPRQSWSIGAHGGEYDVPQCKPGTPVEECTHEISGVMIPGGDNLHLAAVHFHCHAPTCLAMELYHNVTGELLCKQDPIYGGTGKIDQPKFDEPGYILQPPCLWGDQPGLEPMPLASGVPFMIKAITNSTYGHHGEMAFPEITLVPWNTTTDKAQPGYMHKEHVTSEWRFQNFQ